MKDYKEKRLKEFDDSFALNHLHWQNDGVIEVTPIEVRDFLSQTIDQTEYRLKEKMINEIKYVSDNAYSLGWGIKCKDCGSDKKFDDSQKEYGDFIETEINRIKEKL